MKFRPGDHVSFSGLVRAVGDDKISVVMPYGEVLYIRSEYLTLEKRTSFKVGDKILPKDGFKGDGPFEIFFIKNDQAVFGDSTGKLHILDLSWLEPAPE